MLSYCRRKRACPRRALIACCWTSSYVASGSSSLPGSVPTPDTPAQCRARADMRPSRGRTLERIEMAQGRGRRALSDLDLVSLVTVDDDGSQGQAASVRFIHSYTALSSAFERMAWPLVRSRHEVSVFPSRVTMSSFPCSARLLPLRMVLPSAFWDSVDVHAELTLCRSGRVERKQISV
jgi:hypothetical protein